MLIHITIKNQFNADSYHSSITTAAETTSHYQLKNSFQAALCAYVSGIQLRV